MKHINPGRPEHRVRLRELAGTEAWGAAYGAQVFGLINGPLLRLPERTIVVLDFSGISKADVSFLREGVGEIVRKYRPNLLFMVAGLTDPDVLSNLESALMLRGDTLLLRQADGYAVPLGKKLPSEHEVTLRAIQGREEFTSAMLTSKPFSLESSTASARLTALWKAGLIDRAPGAAPSGGKEYKYFPIR